MPPKEGEVKGAGGLAMAPGAPPQAPGASIPGGQKAGIGFGKGGELVATKREPRDLAIAVAGAGGHYAGC